MSEKEHDFLGFLKSKPHHHVHGQKWSCYCPGALNDVVVPPAPVLDEVMTVGTAPLLPMGCSWTRVAVGIEIPGMLNPEEKPAGNVAPIDAATAPATPGDTVVVTVGVVPTIGEAVVVVDAMLVKAACCCCNCASACCWAVEMIRIAIELSCPSYDRLEITKLRRPPPPPSMPKETIGLFPLALPAICIAYCCRSCICCISWGDAMPGEAMYEDCWYPYGGCRCRNSRTRSPMSENTCCSRTCTFSFTYASFPLLLLSRWLQPKLILKRKRNWRSPK